MYGRCLGRALLACALLSILPAAAPAATTGSARASFGDAVIRHVNAERRRIGVRPLRRSSALAEIAGRHALDLGALGRLDHTSSDGTRMADRVRRRVRARRVAETLAWLPQGQSGAVLAVRAWMRSPSHRAALLSPAFRRIGVARRPAMRGVVVAADLASAS